MISFFRSGWSVLLCYLLASIIYLLPYLQHPAFNLIDDGWSLSVGHMLTHDPTWEEWQSILVEASVGRIRPVYYFYFVIMYQFFGAQPIFYWIAQVLILFLTLSLLWKIGSLITKDSQITRLVPFFFLAHPSIVENFNRLGPAEPRQFIFVLLFIVWLVFFLRKQALSVAFVATGALLFALALLSKETSLILLPMIVVCVITHWIVNKTIQRHQIGSLVLLAGVSLAFIALIPSRTGYTEGYKLDVSSILRKGLELRLHQAELFWPLSILFLLTAARGFISYTLLSQSLKETVKLVAWPVVFVTGIAASLALLLPWEHFQLERYLYIPVGLFILYACTELNLFRDWFGKHYSKHKNLLLVIVVCLVVAALTTKFIIFHNFGSRYGQLLARSTAIQSSLYKEYQLSYPLIKFLLTDIPPGATLFVGDEDYERIYQIGLFASGFTEREVTIYTANKMVINDFGAPYTLIGEKIVASQQNCETLCYLVYRPDYYKNPVFGPLPPDDSREFIPHDLENTIPKNQRWYISVLNSN